MSYDCYSYLVLGVQNCLCDGLGSLHVSFRVAMPFWPRASLQSYADDLAASKHASGSLQLRQIPKSHMHYMHCTVKRDKHRAQHEANGI